MRYSSAVLFAALVVWGSMSPAFACRSANHATIVKPTTNDRAGIITANCNARAAKPALGQRYTQELREHMRQASGASQVVQRRRGMAYTMESKTDRLILSTAADATIVGVDCN